MRVELKYDKIDSRHDTIDTDIQQEEEWLDSQDVGGQPGC
jgi:hypothetical protein